MNFELTRITYFCSMEKGLIDAEIRQVILEDGSEYFYTSKPVEITNSLGASVAVLDEYFITKQGGETYKLYKTKEGNWYDVPESNQEVDKGILLALKLKINSE